MNRFSLIYILFIFFVANSTAQTDENNVFINNEASINSGKLEYSPAF